jgi:hypothetical protein
VAELLADKGVGQITIRTDAVPVAFVAVESGSDQFRIAFAKQNGHSYLLVAAGITPKALRQEIRNQIEKAGLPEE